MSTADTARRATQERRRGWPGALLGFRGAIVVLWLAGFIVYARAMPNHDIVWILTATSKWLDGARLYRDVVEVNPPLILYLNVPPVILSELAGIRAYTAFVGYVFGLIGMSVAFTAVLARRLEPDGAGRWVLTLAVLLALVAFPSTDFGQREHLMLVLCLPYLLLAALRADAAEADARIAGLIGLFGGLGFCLKPFFLLVPLSLELYLAAQLRARWSLRRPEMAALAFVGLAYGASIPLLAPDYLRDVVPRALLVYQRGYSSPPALVLVTWQTLALPLVLFALAVIRRKRRHRQLTQVLLLSATAFYVIYLVQMKGWTYHVLPVTALLFLLAATSAAWGRHRVLGAALAAAILAVPLSRGTYRNNVTEALAPVVDRLAGGKGGALYVLSSYNWVGFPLVERAGLHWSSRFPALWLLPGAIRGRHDATTNSDPELAAAYAGIERYVINAVVEDLARDPPAVVIVDKRPDPRFGGLGFRYLPFFCRDPRFARIWARYEKATRVERNGIGPYDIYVRRASGMPAATIDPGSCTGASSRVSRSGGKRMEGTER